MFELVDRRHRETAREYASRVLKHNISNLNLTPGSSISENEISKQLGISRTPVREAFIDLARANVIEIFPQRGTYVSLIDNEMVAEARFLRLALEEAIMPLVCSNITQKDILALEENMHLQQFYVEKKNFTNLLELDNKFHELLFESCQKRRVYAFVEDMMTHFDRVRILSLEYLDPDRIVADHRSLLDAIKDGRTEEACALIKTHLSRVLVDMNELQRRYPEFFKV